MAPRIAIAHDYLTQRGGAERVVLSLSRAFPEATIHTLFYEPEQTYPEFRNLDIRVSPLNRIGPFRRDPRLALPLLAPASSRMAIDADVVIASSSGWAHGFPTSGRKIVYCHSPARWLYLPEDYLGEAGSYNPKRLALAVLSPLLKRWDQRAAMTAETYLASATSTASMPKRSSLRSAPRWQMACRRRSRGWTVGFRRTVRWEGIIWSSPGCNRTNMLTRWWRLSAISPKNDSSWSDAVRSESDSLRWLPRTCGSSKASPMRSSDGATGRLQR